MGIHVMLCDDQTLVRIGLRTLVAAHPDLDVVGEADDGSQVLGVARRLHPNVVVIDIAMFELIDSKARTGLVHGDDLSSCGVVALAGNAHASDGHLVAALQAGARGLIRKEGPAEELVQAIRVVAAGEALVAPPFTRRLLDRFADRLPRTAPSLASLTSRERQILEFVAQGLSNREIAAELSLCESTIKCYVSGVLAKLGLRDRAQAVAAAFRAGLVLY
jgi:DNA-binding NarL/FixJ family response regulator